MAVANREVVANGNVVVLQVFMEHIVHVSKPAIWMFVFSELSNNNTSDMGHQPTQLDIMQHAVNLRNALARIFKEEDESDRR